MQETYCLKIKKPIKVLLKSAGFSYLFPYYWFDFLNEN